MEKEITKQSTAAEQDIIDEKNKQRAELAHAEMFLMNKLNLTRKELLTMRLAITGPIQNKGKGSR